MVIGIGSVQLHMKFHRSTLKVSKYRTMACRIRFQISLISVSGTSQLMNDIVHE